MKIAFILNFMEPTGGDRIIWHHVKGLRENNHEVSVYSIGPLHPGLPIVWDNEEVTIFERGKIKEIDFSSFDLIVGNGLWGAKNALEINNPNKVFFCQNFDPWVFRNRPEITENYINNIYSQYEDFLVYSKDLGKAITNKYGKKQIHLIPNGVEYEKLKPYQNKEYKNNKRICFMGVYNHVLKGINLAKETFELLNQKGYTTVHINGIKEKIGNEKEFYAAPPFEEKCKIVANCSVFLNTSLFETWCLATHEAMGLGTPVVCTNSKGINEYMTNGKDAIIVKERSAKAMVDAIEELVNNKEMYEKIQKNAIENASQYDWAKIMPKIEEQYKAIVNSFKTKRTN